MKCINYRHIGFIAILITLSPFSNGQVRHSIVELELDKTSKINYKLNTITLSDVEYNLENNDHQFTNDNGVLKSTIVHEQPLAISNRSILPFFIPEVCPLEPGDSIRILKNGDKFSFTGSGAAKFEMLYKIGLYMTQLRVRNLHSKGERYTVNSLNEYLHYRNVLDSLWRYQLSLLKQYRNDISRFTFVCLKGYFLNQYRYYLCSKFSILSLKRMELGLNNKDLIHIFDSTLKQLAFKRVEESDTSNLAPVSIGLRKYAEMDYGRSIGFRKEIERNEILKIKAERYYHAKKIYSGLAQQKALLAILMGRIMHKVTDKAENEITKDYLSLVKNSPSAQYVKAFLEKDEALKKGKMAPWFTLKDRADKNITFDSLKGKVVLMDFWFTGCTGCAQMSGPLKEVEKQFKGNSHMAFVNISTDKVKSQWINSVIKEKYTSNSAINLYTGGLGDRHTVIRDYNIRSYPAIFLIDSTGKFVKPVPDPRQDNGRSLAFLIKRLLPVSPIDGPYVLYKNGNILIKSIDSIKNKLNLNEEIIAADKKKSIQLKIAIGNSGIYFTTRLKDSLTVEPSEYDKPSRLLAISDIEGNFDSFLDLLIHNKVIDQNFNWIFGDGHLVLSGDFFDRGDQVTETLWLIYSLEEKSKLNGGYVHFILGNHEIMNLSGDIRYVNNKYKSNSRMLNEDYVYTLYGKNSELGRWLRTKNIIEKIGDIIYTHAGVSPELTRLNLSLNEINSMARPYYDIESKNIKNYRIATIMGSKTSPFWYRGYYKGEGVLENQVDSILTLYKASKIVTGHTLIGEAAKISSHFNGKVINTDTHHAAGLSAALLFENNQFYQVDFAGRKEPLFDKNNKELVSD